MGLRVYKKINNKALNTLKETEIARKFLMSAIHYKNCSVSLSLCIRN